MSTEAVAKALDRLADAYFDHNEILRAQLKHTQGLSEAQKANLQVTRKLEERLTGEIEQAMLRHARGSA